MNKQTIQKTLALLKKEAKKRNFNQSIDLIVNLKQLNIKKDSINEFVLLHFDYGKKNKICALVDKEMIKSSNDVFDKTLAKEEFSKLDKKTIKKLAKEYDFFVAQARMMPDVAKVFGRALGPRGKMPNPKIGCVITPAVNLKELYDKLQKTVRIATKNELIIKNMVGKEDMKEEELVDNILTIYNSIVNLLPQGQVNIKNILLKLTMGKAYEVKDDKTKNS